MFDLLSLLQGRGEKTLTGTYYSKTPPTTDSAPFDYEIIEGNSRRYQLVTGNLRADGSTLVISTKDHLEWKINGKVVLQDGKMYIIESIKDDIQEVKKTAYRIHSNSYDMDYIISLVETENVWGLK